MRAALVLLACLEPTMSQDLFLQREGSTSAKVGMMYEGWHAPAYWGRGSAGLTVETVVRSNGSLSLADMRTGWDQGKAMNFYWHKEPADGFYCIYRKRSNETKGANGLPDCPGITATLTRHAKMLVDAGIDFVVADSTNFKNIAPASDAIQLRPWEVLAEEWLALRKQGVLTPQIAIWQNLQDASSDLWRAYADGAYVDPAYEELIFKDEHTGKKVFFATSDPAPQLVQELEGRGLAVVTMWAQRNNFAKGEWAFFSACTDSKGGFTDSVSSDPNVPCKQHSTTNSAIGAHGTSLTVGPSWQLSYASLPFRAAGKHGGLTLRKQFEKAFAMNAAGGLDYLMVGTFNEHVAQPQPNPFAGNEAAISMGMEGDDDASRLWVDMYGDAISRDLEPTKEDGGRQWAIFESCMRVFQSGASSCSASSETCCDTGDALAQWVSVFSLELKTPFADSLLTTSAAERSGLAKGAWSELCAPHGGASEFCKGNNPPAADYRRGPFLLYAGQPPSPARSSPVHRCLANGTPRHFPSSDESCRGLGTAESVLGYASLDRSTETPRSLRLCRRSKGGFYHSLDATCGEHDAQLEHLGFVH